MSLVSSVVSLSFFTTLVVTPGAARFIRSAWRRALLDAFRIENMALEDIYLIPSEVCTGVALGDGVGVGIGEL